MQFSENVFMQIGIVFLGICGFAVARHIRNHKTKHTPLICPIRFDCHTVVHSDYSKFFGIPVEILGIIYYAVTSLSYLFIIFIPSEMSVFWVNFLIVAPLTAFVFSFYLILVQIFVLRKGCSWCIVSSVISASIFILTVLMYHWNYILGVLEFSFR